MSSSSGAASGVDWKQGVSLAELEEGKPLAGHVGDDPVMAVRRGEEVFALSSTCSHYGGPLAEGLVVGDTVRCPWHHACFSLRSGEALHAPALNPVDCWKVEQRGGKVFVSERLQPAAPKPNVPAAPASVVIVGAGAAGHAAAEMLRRQGYRGPLALVTADASPPVDRPNLSKDYLAGTAPEEWIPLRPPEFYADHDIKLTLGQTVTRLDPATKSLALSDGSSLTYGACLLATGAEPVRLNTPGAELPHVHLLRSLADSRSIIEGAKSAKQAVVLSTSFIGLEVAASLRARGLEVTVVGPQAIPLEPVLGPEVGKFIRGVHESHGVAFRMGETAASITADKVTLVGGEVLPAQLVVAGVGVRPLVALAQAAGLKVDDGVVVNAQLETSATGVYAAGDIARWPDSRFGGSLRVEHWVVAQRQGQTAARNMLSQRVAFNAVPFFWSNHFDLGIHYVGHARKFDRVQIDGSLEKRDCTLRYQLAGKTLAVATIGRDLASLEAELGFEQAS